MKRYTEYLLVTAAAITAVVIALAAYAWSGFYDIGADRHHWRVTFAVLQVVRDRSIARHSEAIDVPNLDDPQLILKGAGQYAAMCAGCHLQPGVGNSEMRAGLYPQPPNLSRTQLSPRDAFWVIKHGIKMSAMPAWGRSHDDRTIWSMVAFLRKLPGLTSQQYKEIVARAPPDEDMGMSSKDSSPEGKGSADPQSPP